MTRNMGFDFGLEKGDVCFIRKFRWLFYIPDISADGVNALPPLKAARPNLSFKEIEIPHLNETIIRPGKPEWKPITLTLYDIKKSAHPVWDWINLIYNPGQSTFRTPVDSEFIKYAYLEMLGGCGETQELWLFENVWPQNIDFGDLDMTSSDIVTCDLTLRYDRAYIV